MTGTSGTGERADWHYSKIYPSDELRWFALRVEPTKEEMTVRILENRAMLALFPTHKITRNVSRYVSRTVEIERPSLTGYVFIAFPRGEEIPWWAVRKIHLVQSVVRVDGHPAEIDYSALFRLFVPPEFFKVQVQHHKRIYQHGEKVKMTAGSFMGIKAEIEEATADEAIVRLGLLGGALITVPVDSIEPIQVAQAA